MLPPLFRPMLAAPAEEPFDDPDYLFEPKMDGFRCLAFWDRGAVDLYSRTGRVVTEGYPEVVARLARLPGDGVADGELVVPGPDGVPLFALIQQRNYATAPPLRSLELYPVSFVAFDLCWRDGAPLFDVPLGERRPVLERLPGLDCVPSVAAAGVALYQRVVPAGLEGIVGKRLDSVYRPGARSRAWRKVKAVRHDHVVIAGFTAGTGGRAATFGSLVMAQWDGVAWLHVGEVGTGFDDATLSALRAALDEITAPQPPGPGWPRVPAVTWVEPGIVIAVEHRGWTQERRLRATSFKGLVARVDPFSVMTTAPR